MSNNNKLLFGAITGALAGIGVMLFNKDIRNSAVNSMKSCANKTVHVLKNPKEKVNDIVEGVSNVNGKIKRVVDDTDYILEKVIELTEKTPQLIETIKDTRDQLKVKAETSEE